jgi:hypothetical protein
MRLFALLATFFAAVSAQHEVRSYELSSEKFPMNIPTKMGSDDFNRAELAIAVRAVPRSRGMRPKFFTH